MDIFVYYDFLKGLKAYNKTNTVSFFGIMELGDDH